MFFLHRPDTDEYITIHRQDEQYLDELVNSNFFYDEYKNPSNQLRFNIIKDKDKIKKILEDKFSSKNRGEEYAVGLPSATLISSKLFPYCLDTTKSHNKAGLLRWANNVSVEDLNATRLTTKLSTDTGEFIHETLERALLDRSTRPFKKQFMLNDYIEDVCKYGKVNTIIDNFEGRKEYFKAIASKVLKNFFIEELPHIDVVASELFVKTKGLQGAVDLIGYKHGNLYIFDHKTSKKAMSYNQAPEKGYWRQLYLYQQMLLKSGIISKKEWETLKFQINFFNWSSCRSTIYNIPKKDIDKCKLYCEFILKWYINMRNLNINISEVI